MKTKRTNYKSMYGITLKDAKAKCKEINGRLPRVGYETLIEKVSVKVYRENGTFWGSGTRFLYLQNDGGKYRLWHYTQL